MARLMFALFVIVSFALLGVAVFSIPLRYLLWRKTHDREQAWHVVLKSGITLLVGMFLFIVIPKVHAALPASVALWVYLISLITIGVGAAGLAGGAMRALLDQEEREHDRRKAEADCE